MKPPAQKRIEPEALTVKKSMLPGAGKGLFAAKSFDQGQIIIEYKGAITTYKKIQENKVVSPYVYFVNNNYVIDANNFPNSVGRYANDAEGLTTYPGMVNNAKFILLSKKVYLQAAEDILPGAEIFVAYGKKYWDAIRFNLSLSKMKKNTGKTKRK